MSRQPTRPPRAQGSSEMPCRVDADPEPSVMVDNERSTFKGSKSWPVHIIVIHTVWCIYNSQAFGYGYFPPLARKEIGMTYSQMLEQHHGSEDRMSNALERGDLRKEEIADGVFAYFYPQIKRAPSP